jgi:hypothetical protein
MKRRDLFGAEDAADSHFRVNSHPQLSGLRGREFVDALFDDGLVYWFRVHCLIERDVCFAHAAVGQLPFVFVFVDDLANRLALIRRQPELLDRIGTSGLIGNGSLLAECERSSHEEK